VPSRTERCRMKARSCAAPSRSRCRGWSANCGSRSRVSRRPANTSSRMPPPVCICTYVLTTASRAGARSLLRLDTQQGEQLVVAGRADAALLHDPIPAKVLADHRRRRLDVLVAGTGERSITSPPSQTPRPGPKNRTAVPSGSSTAMCTDASCRRSRCSGRPLRGPRRRSSPRCKA
jgi:hypothetical protein